MSVKIRVSATPNSVVRNPEVQHQWTIFFFVFYYESRKRELKTRFIYEDLCDERLKARVKLRNLHAPHTLGGAIPAVIHGLSSPGSLSRFFFEPLFFEIPKGARSFEE